jgi:hypothetical protein
VGSKSSHVHDAGYSKFGGYPMQSLDNENDEFQRDAGLKSRSVKQAFREYDGTTTVDGDNLSEESILRG